MQVGSEKVAVSHVQMWPVEPGGKQVLKIRPWQSSGNDAFQEAVGFSAQAGKSKLQPGVVGRGLLLIEVFLELIQE